MAESLWEQWRGRIPTAAELEKVSRAEREAHQFAVNAIDLVLVRLDELASRDSVDTVELQSVSDELRVVRRELAVKISRI